MTHINDDMLAVVGPHINDGLAAFFKGDPLDPGDPSVTAAYRFTDGSLTPVKGPALTFTRAGVAHVVDRYKVLNEVPANVPRFPGAIYTKNWALWSQDQSNAQWRYQNGATYVSGGESDPLGGNNAHIVDIQGTTAAFDNYTALYNLNKNGSETPSWWMKAGTKSQIGFGNTGGRVRILIDLAAGTVTNVGSLTDAPLGIEPYADGWYRVWVNEPLKGNAASWFGFSQANTDQSDGTMLIFGYQMERKTNAPPEPGPYLVTDAAVAIAHTGQALGVQTEGPSTNLALSSENLTVAWWQKDEVTVVLGDALAPNGQAGFKIVPSVTNISHRAFADVTLDADGPLAASMYFAADGYSFVRLFVGSYAIVANLDTGEIVSTAGTPKFAELINYGGGIYKAQIGGTYVAGNIRIQIGVYADATLAAFPGDGTSGVMAWGLQVEKGTRPTSYIRTTGVAASREPERLVPDDVSWIDGSVGTIYCRYGIAPFVDTDLTWGNVWRAVGSGSEYIFSDIDQTGARTGQNRFYWRGAGGQSVTQGSNTDYAPPSVNARVAHAYDLTALSHRACYNGTLASEGALVGPAPVIAQFYFGSSNGTATHFNGVIAEFAFSNVRKPDDELQRITTP